MSSTGTLEEKTRRVTIVHVANAQEKTASKRILKTFVGATLKRGYEDARLKTIATALSMLHKVANRRQVVALRFEAIRSFAKQHEWDFIQSVIVVCSF